MTKIQSSQPIRRYRGVALFGPPGSGKSTLLRALKLRGLRTLDLEHFKTREERLSAARGLALMSAAEAPQFVGAADLSTGELPDYYSVVLLPHQKLYDDRRLLRDLIQPDKANQADVYRAFETGATDHVYNAVFTFMSDQSEPLTVRASATALIAVGDRLTPLNNQGTP